MVTNARAPRHIFAIALSLTLYLSVSQTMGQQALGNLDAEFDPVAEQSTGTDMWDYIFTPEMLLILPGMKHHFRTYMLFPGLAPAPDTMIMQFAANGAAVEGLSGDVSGKARDRSAGIRIHGVRIGRKQDMTESPFYLSSGDTGLRVDDDLSRNYAASLELWYEPKNLCPVRGISVAGTYALSGSEQKSSIYFSDEREHLYYSDLNHDRERELTLVLRSTFLLAGRHRIRMTLAAYSLSDSAFQGRSTYDTAGALVLRPAAVTNLREAHYYTGELLWLPCWARKGELSLGLAVRTVRDVGYLDLESDWRPHQDPTYDRRYPRLAVLQNYARVLSIGNVSVCVSEGLEVAYGRQQDVAAEYFYKFWGGSLSSSLALQHQVGSITLFSGIRGITTWHQDLLSTEEPEREYGSNTKNPVRAGIDFIASPLIFVWQPLSCTRLAFVPVVDGAGVWLWSFELQQKFAPRLPAR